MSGLINQLVIVVIGVIAFSFTSGIFITKDECPPNEEYLLCGSACPFNCSDPVGPVNCTQDCVEGCFCKSGMLRNENGTCVNADECFEDTNSTLCGPNEEFLTCGGACTPTCAQPIPPTCDSPCSIGCFCKAGYVRDKNNQCIALGNCPVEQCFNENEVFDICSAACEPSCADPVPICTQVCMSGCTCAPGLLRNETGSCVSLNECGSSGNATDPGLLGKYLNVINKILHLTSTS